MAFFRRPEELTRPEATRHRLLDKQPDPQVRVKVWRKGQLLFPGEAWAVEVEWGALVWTDGGRKLVNPELTDEWAPIEGDGN